MREIYKYSIIKHRKEIKELDTDCIFCRPSIDRDIITESALTYAMYDGFPVSPGHALIIPKVHIGDYFKLNNKIQQACWFTMNHVKLILDKKYKPDGFNIGINISAASGQTIWHVHIHLIPRYKGDVENPRGGIRHVISGKGYY